MLQIITGRFFKTNELYRTQQQTVLYSNYRGRNSIDTLVGRYAPTAPSSDVTSAVYMVEQCLEAVGSDGSRAIIIAVHPEALAQDFAALLSFCLRITCTLDPALVSRLSQSNRPPIGVSTHPSRMVEQIFDREVWPGQVDETVFPDFVANLVRLERVRYKAVMRAIQRYVVGLHRIGDDLALSYTLLVASIESLAHSFDQFEVSWGDFDPRKRKRIDEALAGAESALREAVHSAILEVEHVALARRFQEFALAHLPPSFYREEAASREGPVRSYDLPVALKRAYTFRSRLVHRLEELPALLTHESVRADIIEVDRKPTLTFNGLARVARRVIMRFVELSPKLDTEDFNYRADLPGVFSVPAAPRYWIWKADQFNARTARRFFCGFLGELVSVLTGHENGLTDIRDVLEKIEQQVPELAPVSRLPMVGLYLLYCRHVKTELHRPAAELFLDEHVFLFDEPSLESLICHAVLSQPTGWDPDIQEGVLRGYREQRCQRNGLEVGPILEVAMILETAEAYRLSGDTQRVQNLLSDAVENLPGNSVLLEIEKKGLTGKVGPLRWRDILLPLQHREEEKTNCP
jgi:hypothetical protein